MATGALDLPILISQLPHMQQVAGPQHMPAEAQQVLFSQLVADQQRQNDHKVQTVEKDDGLAAMGRESGGNRNHGQQMAQQRKFQHQEADPGTSTQASNASPWSGNIINVKI